SCPYTQTKKCFNLAISQQKRSILLKIYIIISTHAPVRTARELSPTITQSIHSETRTDSSRAVPHNRTINITHKQPGQLPSCPYTQTKKCLNLALSQQKRSIPLKISIIISIHAPVRTAHELSPTITQSI